MNRLQSSDEGDIRPSKTEKEFPIASPCLRRIMVLAEKERQARGDYLLSVHHLLIAMRQDGNNHGSILMDEFEITLEQLQKSDFSDHRKKKWRWPWPQ